MKKSLLTAVALMAILFTGYSQDRSTNPEKYFLLYSEVMDSQAFLPAPPDTTSMRYALDKAQYEWGKTMRDTDRGRQAVRDANLGPGWFDNAFSEAFGFKLTRENAPHVYELLTLLMEDAGDLGTRKAKQHYMRPRPFMVFNETSATPDDEPMLRNNGSYPSGHTTIGWATALVLSELNPDRQLEIMKRGYEFGQSRVICGVHYQSDVDAGRLIGAAAVARLHADKGFQKKLAKAKKEVAGLKKKAAKK